jgi:hypothetical protein
MLMYSMLAVAPRSTCHHAETPAGLSVCVQDAWPQRVSEFPLIARSASPYLTIHVLVPHTTPRHVETHPSFIPVSLNMARLDWG